MSYYSVYDAGSWKQVESKSDTSQLPAASLPHCSGVPLMGLGVGCGEAFPVPLLVLGSFLANFKIDLSL